MKISGAVRIDKLINDDKQIILVSDIHTSFNKKGCKSLFNKKYNGNIFKTNKNIDKILDLINPEIGRLMLNLPNLM